MEDIAAQIASKEEILRALKEEISVMAVKHGELNSQIEMQTVEKAELMTQVNAMIIQNEKEKMECVPKLAEEVAEIDFRMNRIWRTLNEFAGADNTKENIRNMCVLSIVAKMACVVFYMTA